MLNPTQISLAKGMLDRGDKQHDIAQHFGINAGRIAEIATGKLGAGIKSAPIDILPNLDERRYIDPNTPVEKQIAVLMQLIKRPPENSRRVVVTPQLASYILTHLNPHNRPRKPKFILRYAEDMTNGQWMLTGDTIKFGKSGILRDGQNRLTACVRAGVAFETYMVFGIDDASFTVMDTGRTRGGDDVFTIAGIANANVASAATRWVLIFTSDRPDDRSATFDNQTLLDEYKRLNRKEFDACVKEAKTLHRHLKALPASTMAALLYLFRRKNFRATAAFLADLKGSRGSARKLVARIDELRLQNGGRLHENVRNALVILTWQAYVAGRGLRKADLSWDVTKEFPEI